MQDLLRKEAVLKIPFKKESFIFIIPQATLYEILEFDYYVKKDDGSIVQHIFNILKAIEPKFTAKHFNHIKSDYFSKIYIFFLKNYCSGFYDLTSTVEDSREVDEEIEGRPFNSTIASIITASNETMESLLNLTWDQISYMFEGFVYNQNEQTDEGKKENLKNKTKEELKKGKYDETLENLRKQREKVNAKYISKK